MGLSFVPVTIASLTGVERPTPESHRALINTSRQIGGAIGIAASSAIAASSTSNYVHAHSVVRDERCGSLDHGFQTALYALTGLLLIGALIAVHARQVGAGSEHATPFLSRGELVAPDEAASTELAWMLA